MATTLVTTSLVNFIIKPPVILDNIIMIEIDNIMHIIKNYLK